MPWPKSLDWHGPTGMQLDRNTGKLFTVSLDGISVFDAKNLSNWHVFKPTTLFPRYVFDFRGSSFAVDAKGENAFVPVTTGGILGINLLDNVRHVLLKVPITFALTTVEVNFLVSGSCSQWFECEMVPI